MASGVRVVAAFGEERLAIRRGQQEFFWNPGSILLLELLRGYTGYFVKLTKLHTYEKCVQNTGYVLASGSCECNCKQRRDSFSKKEILIFLRLMI